MVEHWILFTLCMSSRLYNVYTRPDCTFRMIPGHALDDGDSQTIGHLSLEECERTCLLAEHLCKSFNYNSETSVCTLNRMNVDGAPGMLVERDGTDYWGKECTAWRNMQGDQPMERIQVDQPMGGWKLDRPTEADECKHFPDSI